MNPPKLMMMRMMIKMMITVPPRREGSMCFQRDHPQASVATRTPRTWRDLKIIGNFMSCAPNHIHTWQEQSVFYRSGFGASLFSPVELLLHYIAGEPGWEGVLDYSSCDIINVTRRREKTPPVQGDQYLVGKVLATSGRSSQYVNTNHLVCGDSKL